MEPTPTTTAVKFVRAMRGSTRPCLVECEDGYRYVVKSRRNPQGTRVVVNELVCSLLMRMLSIETPQPAIVSITEEFLRSHADDGCLAHGLEAGLHFGSRHSETGKKTTVLQEYLPEPALSEVINRADFAGALVFDKWVSNGDSRQAVFYRAVLAGETERRPAWFATMIDNGLAFQGQRWFLEDSPIAGVYGRRIVYGRDSSLRTFVPWLARLMQITPAEIDEAFAAVPRAWVAGQEHEFESLQRKLYRRRERVLGLVRQTLEALRPARLQHMSAPRLRAVA